jgi:hypothetical protein
LVLPLLREVPLSRTSRFPPGEFARAADAERPVFRLIRATSLSDMLDRLPMPIYEAVIIASAASAMAFVPLWLIALVVDRIQGTAGAMLTLLTLGGGVSFYSIASSAFGDGPADVHRHALGIVLGLAAQLAATAPLVKAIPRAKARGVATRPASPQTRPPAPRSSPNPPVP